ncbi:MAG: Hsp20/alpha crystallin family protein [Armatimonadetes bacterium]|nr:Hsp20/alpha crystallin family protein [Armatimonadota bacterium]
MLVPYSPLSELAELQRRIARVFDDARAQRERLAERERLVPPVDLVLTGEGYEARVDLPGVKPEDIKVVVEEGYLVIRGNKPAADAEGRVARRERQFGEFARSVPLPSDADASQASAKLENGVLTVKIGRRAPAKQVEVAVVG